MMTDLEMTKPCAEAMGYQIDYSEFNGGGAGNTGFDINGAAVLDWHENRVFDPLHDKAQLADLIIEMELQVSPHKNNEKTIWLAAFPFTERSSFVGHHTENESLHRAAVKCVAKMQAAKTKDPA